MAKTLEVGETARLPNGNLGLVLRACKHLPDCFELEILNKNPKGHHREEDVVIYARSDLARMA